MSDAREFWSDANGNLTPLAATETAEDAAVVWDALLRCRRYVEERAEGPGWKGRLIRRYDEDETPKIKTAADLEREGIVP